ncbi:class I adenylate-forming enzyme family protein [Phytohabitans kaempferiae]|uniref:Class I adenylate-forming enzyme family protein n=1 Tax=Phytohabitans kaempferiae TaxID=1620943 RepID=A0ABV6MFB2_9ACTN
MTSPGQSEPPTLLDAFLHRAEADPDAEFLIPLSGEPVTYGTALHRSRRLAAWLRASGVRQGDRIGLHLRNDENWPIATFAVWMLGCEAVVLGSLLRPAELRALVGEAGPALLLTGDEEVRADDVGIPVALLGPDLYASGPGSPEPDLARVTPDPGGVACVFCTSGTTGTPKLVPHTHADLAGAARQMASVYPSRPGFRTTAAPPRVPPGVIFYPFGHVAAYHAFAFRLWVGRRMVLVPKFSVEAFAAVLARYPVDALQLVPAMLHALVTTEKEIDLSGVRYVTAGTAPLTAEVRQAFERRYGVPILQTYGSTEAGPVAHVRYRDIVEGRHPAGSVGRPAPDVEVRINGETGTPARTGDDGEIVVRRGGPDGRWVRTGDVGRMDADGFLFVTGRISDMLIVGGFNVFPSDVEQAIRATGLVRDVVVVARPDDRLGEVPVAGVVWADRSAEAELVHRLRGTLAHYKVPREFRAIDEVPLTPRGKVDRLAAAELLRVPAGPAGRRP